MTRILAVDDDPAICEMLTNLLTRSGYEVAIAQSARDALRILFDWQPQAMIMDIVMPEMDGIELLREIRRQDPLLPVVAITGGCMGLVDPLGTLMAAMGAEMLTKPVLPHDLLAALERCLDRRQEELP